MEEGTRQLCSNMLVSLASRPRARPRLFSSCAAMFSSRLCSDLAWPSVESSERLVSKGGSQGQAVIMQYPDWPSRRRLCFRSRVLSNSSSFSGTPSELCTIDGIATLLPIHLPKVSARRGTQFRQVSPSGHASGPLAPTQPNCALA